MRYSELFHTSLKQCKDKDKALDIQVLIGEAFHLSRTAFWIKKDDTVNDKGALKKFYRCRSRLLKDEPLAYILKKKEFLCRDFFINKNVLIPRPETEILVEKAIEWILDVNKPVQVLEIGAGSGNIAISLAKAGRVKVVAVDISPRALYVLKKNIALHYVKDKVTPVYADLFPLMNKGGDKSFDLIVSNPPYVSEEEWAALPAGIRNYEPKNALVAAEGGTAVIRRIAEKAGNYLKPKGRILMEIGFGQNQQVDKIFKRAGFSNVTFFNDYRHIPRVVSAQR